MKTDARMREAKKIGRWFQYELPREIRKVLEKEKAPLKLEIAILRLQNAAFKKAITAWKVRLAFTGHPREPKDWSKPVRLSDEALAITDPAYRPKSKCPSTGTEKPCNNQLCCWSQRRKKSKIDPQTARWIRGKK